MAREARKQRGKKVQVAKLQERERGKEVLEGVEVLKRSMFPFP